MNGEETWNKVKKQEKKAKKRAKKEAKRSAKRARKESKKDGGSSSSSSDDEGDNALRQLAMEAARGGPVPLPAAARWQGPAVAPVASIADLKAQLAAAQSARIALAQRGPSVSSSQIMPLRQSEAEVEMRGLRAARFEQTAAEQALAAARSRPVPKLPAGQVLRGESQALEKSYLRLTSMPRPDQAPSSTAPHAHVLPPTHCRARTARAARAAALKGRRPSPPSAGGHRCARCQCYARRSQWWDSGGRRRATASTITYYHHTYHTYHTYTYHLPHLPHPHLPHFPQPTTTIRSATTSTRASSSSVFGKTSR